MSLAGLPEDLARTIRQTRPQKVIERERQRQLEAEARASTAFIPESQKALHARVATCELMLRGVRAASKVLAASGSDLERIHRVVIGKQGFKEAMDSGDPPLPRQGAALLATIGALGRALRGLSGALGGDVLEGLQVMQNEIREACSAMAEEMATLEEEEFESAEAVKQASDTKSKVGSQLQNAARTDDDDKGGITGWLWKSTGLSRLQQAAHQQRSAVEELARQMDRATAAAEARKEREPAWQGVLQDVDMRCLAQFRSLQQTCASSWRTTVQSLDGTTKQLGPGDTAGQPGAPREDSLMTETGSLSLSPSDAKDLTPLEICLLEAEEGITLTSPRMPPPTPRTVGGATPRASSAAPPGTPRREPEQAATPRREQDSRAVSPAPRPSADAAEALTTPRAASEAGVPLSARGAAALSARGAPTTPRGPSSAQATPRSSAPLSARGAADAAASPSAAAAAPPLSARGSSASAPLSARGSAAAAAPPLSARGSAAPLTPRGAAAAQPAAGAAPPSQQLVYVSFGEEVEKLGFEVLWEADWPSVLKVFKKSAAQKLGIQSGDVVTEINGVCTQGKTRAELMPLLKTRPLKLALDRPQVGKSPSAAESPAGGDA